jgi:hypothetical protein
VEGAPSLQPVIGHRLADHVAEEVAQALLARGFDVRSELDVLTAIDLLEAGGNEVEQPCPSRLGRLGRDGDRDPAQLAAQRKALLSFSKKPSSAR